MSCLYGGVNALAYWTKVYLFCDPYARRQTIKPPAPRQTDANEASMLASTEAAIRVIETRKEWASLKAAQTRNEAAETFRRSKALERTSPLESVRLKREATNKLRRAKQLDRSITIYEGTVGKLMKIGDSVGMQALNQEVGVIMGDVFKSLTEMKQQAGVDVGKVEEITDDLQQELDNVNEMSTALARPFEESISEDLEQDDEAGLLAELEELGNNPPEMISSSSSSIGSSIGSSSSSYAAASTSSGQDPLQALILANGGRMVPASNVLGTSYGQGPGSMSWQSQHAQYAPPQQQQQQQHPGHVQMSRLAAMQ